MNTDYYKMNPVPVMWTGTSLEKYLAERGDCLDGHP